MIGLVWQGWVLIAVGGLLAWTVVAVVVGLLVGRAIDRGQRPPSRRS